MNKLKEIFDPFFKETIFDQSFAKKVDTFVRQFLLKNNDHVAFFGGNLLGVYPIRWNYSDSDTWWDDIFETSEPELEQALHKHPEIKTNRKVSSDVFNHAIIYCLYRVHHSPLITEKDKDQVKGRLMMALNVKFLSSLMAHYFRYPADKGVAEKTYNSLTKRFDLKVYGTWAKMLHARSEDFISKNGRYYKSYTQYNDDIEIIKMINDAQGRIRDTVKDVTAVYYKCLEADAKLLSSSSSVDLDGVVALKDLSRKPTMYNRYIKQVVSERDSFVKEPIMELVYRAVPSLQPGVFEKLLEVFAKEFQSSKYRIPFNTFIDNLLTFSFDFLKENEIKENDLSGIIYRLKHVYMSGRITSDTLMNARNGFDKIVEAMDRKMKGTPLVPERCAFFLYIVLRTVTMSYFK